MTTDPLIPDLKERLKAMIIGFIKEHKDEDNYEYRILSKFEYFKCLGVYKVYKVIAKSGKVEYCQGARRHRKLTLLKGAESAIDKLQDGTRLSWNQLNELFSGCARKEFDYHNKEKEYYYQDREYHRIYPLFNDTDFLDEILQKVIYDMVGSHIVRNLVRLDQVIGCDLGGFTFTGLEKNEEIPIKIFVGLYKGQDYFIRFGVAPDYINQDLSQIKARRTYYKDEGYYQNKASTSFVFDNSVLRIDYYDIEMEEGCYLSDEFVDRLSHFIYDDNTHIFEIETKQNEGDIERAVDSAYRKDPAWYYKESMYAIINYNSDRLAKGLKIYKIPKAPFDWTHHLEKIKAKLDQLKKSGVMIEDEDIEQYILFTKYDISFEYSPDNYLEIYGTQEALALFFLPRKNEELVGFEMVCDYSSIKDVAIVDHFYPGASRGISAAIYAHHFGSAKNNVAMNKIIDFYYFP